MDTKTDSYKSGQWATFAASFRPNSAYQLYRRLVVALSDELSTEQVSQWPIMFGSERGQLAQSLALSAPKIIYQEFLKILKGGSGRWKSHAFERYIDKEVTLHLQLRAIQLMEVSRA